MPGVMVIELTGKYAIGPHRYSLVDSDRFNELNKFKWKAKPNQRKWKSNTYAVRNIRVNGINKTLRMHRVVLGMDFDDPLDGDHINHNSLDNRWRNLRRATRSENLKNMSPSEKTKAACRLIIRNHVRAKALQFGKYSEVFFSKCSECFKCFRLKRSRQRFCVDRCRERFKSRARRARVLP